MHIYIVIYTYVTLSSLPPYRGCPLGCIRTHPRRRIYPEPPRPLSLSRVIHVCKGACVRVHVCMCANG